MTNSESRLYNMCMHESIELDLKTPHIKATRVPGGLLYTTYIFADQYHREGYAMTSTISTTFVPYKFKEEVEAEQKAKEEFAKHRID